MNSRMTIGLCFALFVIGSCQILAYGQQATDGELPFGSPDFPQYLQDGDIQESEGVELKPSDATSLEQRGIVFDSNVTQFYQGVASGGREQGFAYGGHGDYILNLDLDKLAGKEGLFLKMHAEHRFGQDANSQTGALMPSSILMSLPTASGNEIVLSEFLATQFLSEKFAVFAGKVATVPGDPNQFASGRGREQFSNLAFVANPIPMQAVPYATLAAGFLYTADPLLNQYLKFSVLNPIDTTTTSGFSELFAEGVTLSGEGRMHTNFFGKSGHQLVGAVWTNREFNSLGQDPRILFPPLDIPIARKSGSWAMYWNFDQYLFTDPCNPDQGWGLFGRAGISDGNPNPLEWYCSFGLGGTSPISGRNRDSFGAGWYYLGISNELGPIANTLLDPRDETGIELYYKAAVNDWFEITADVQFVEPALRRDATTAVLAGLRANVKF